VFDGVQTRRLLASRFPLMLDTSIEITAAVPEATSLWPWLALGGVLLLLAIIALGSRRRPPFGL
jgi:hypothetical protein